MSSMIVAKKLMQKHPAGIIITANMRADNTCVYSTQFWLLNHNINMTVIINKAYFDTAF